MKGALRVSLLSDTHGLLRPEAMEFVRASDHIVHAGDIGDAGVLDALRRVAPVTAVRGNNDFGPWAEKIAETELVKICGVSIYVLHDLKQLAVDPAAAGFHVVVSGHSHQPRIDERDGVLLVNPGSCGPRRFKLPVSVGELRISGKSVKPKLVELRLAGA